MYFDIGANMGVWSLANIKTTDKIISIEASPITYNTLKDKVKGYNIEPLNFAICNNNNKDIVFYSCNCHTLSTLNKEWLTDNKSRFYGQKYQEIICQSRTIDYLIQEYGKPDLIKIDVEGGEYECIQSLTQKVDNLCFEWASELNDITYKSLDYLLTLGFTQFYVQYEDIYTFRPTEYTDITNVKEELSKTTPKKEWGMIWCR